MAERSLADLMRLHVDVCPGCGAELGPAVCNFYFSTWHCWGCGANIDGRVVHPKSGLRCENEWADYERHPGDPVHPIACSCSGRGFYIEGED